MQLMGAVWSQCQVMTGMLAHQRQLQKGPGKLAAGARLQVQPRRPSAAVLAAPGRAGAAAAGAASAGGPDQAHAGLVRDSAEMHKRSVQEGERMSERALLGGREAEDGWRGNEGRSVLQAVLLLVHEGGSHAALLPSLDAVVHLCRAGLSGGPSAHLCDMHDEHMLGQLPRPRPAFSAQAD